MQNGLLIFDTHPIQYRAPVFRDLAEKGLDFEVCFFNDQFYGKKWWFKEVGKIPKQNWNLDLKTGYPNQVLELNKRGLLSRYRFLRRLLLERKPKAVVIYGWYLPEHWMVWALCAKHEIPLIFVGETFERGGSFIRSAVKKILHPLFFSRVHGVVSIGDKTYDFYRSLNILPNRITRAKYCVDESFFSLEPYQSQALREQVRKQFKISDNAFVLLFVGRLFERKRPKDLIHIHKNLAKKHNVCTVIAGNGPMEKELKELARGEKNILFPGFCDQKTTRAWYHAADLFVLPSVFETWGLVVNEAFAAGIPAVVTDTCGCAHDLVVPKETGNVYPMGDVEEATRQIAKLILDPILMRKLGERAKAKVSKQYGIQQFSDAIKAAFNQTLLKA